MHEMLFLKTDNSKHYGWISMKFSRKLDVGSNLDHCLDHLDPGSHMRL